MNQNPSPKPVHFSSDDRQRLVMAIHDAPAMLVLAVTGGGIAAITDLLLVPGASRTCLDATVPYSPSALSELVGPEGGDGAVSIDTAKAMAGACLTRARQLQPDANVPVFGVACTAALVTDRDRRGADRACIAIAGDAGLKGWQVDLDKRDAAEGLTGRAAQDRAVADEVLAAIGGAFAVNVLG